MAKKEYEGKWDVDVPQGTVNLSTKAKIIIGTPILYILLVIWCTTYNMFSTMINEQNETWEKVFSYWGFRILEDPIFNIVIPGIMTIVVVGLLAYRGKK